MGWDEHHGGQMWTGSGRDANQDRVRFEWNDETVEVPLPPRLSAHQGALVAFLRDGSESVWVLSDTEVRELLDGETKALPTG